MIQSFLSEFKTFAMKGNVIELAVGVILGTAFGKIVTSLVDDIFMPVLGLIINNVNFNDLVLTVGGATIRYGQFVGNLVNFTLVAFAMFMLIKQMNRLFKISKREDAPQA